MKITYSVAASVDGFIAKENGDVAWLDEMGIDTSESGLEEFFASVDGLVMGRKTYDFVFNYGSWPYEDKLTWVCTSRQLQPLPGANLIVVGDVEAVISDAAAKGLQHLWLLGGGKLASAFLEKGLITNISIAEMPIELGSGIPLFADHCPEDIPGLQKTVIQKNGFRQLEFVLDIHRDTSIKTHDAR